LVAMPDCGDADLGWWRPGLPDHWCRSRGQPRRSTEQPGRALECL